MRYLLPAIALSITLLALAIGTVHGEDSIEDASAPVDGVPPEVVQPAAQQPKTSLMQFAAAAGGLAALLVVAPLSQR